jgi:hypothetical protein
VEIALADETHARELVKDLDPGPARIDLDTGERDRAGHVGRGREGHTDGVKAEELGDVDAVRSRDHESRRDQEPGAPREATVVDDRGDVRMHGAVR